MHKEQNQYVYRIGKYSTVESRFFKPPRETEIGSKNREFEKSKVVLTEIKSKGNEFWFE